MAYPFESNGNNTAITLRRPDDWHLHLRDGAMLKAVLPYSAGSFARAIVMPNLPLPVTNVLLALQYRERILQALPRGSRFTPLMALFLTDDTVPSDVEVVHETGFMPAAKLYPAGATTLSAHGVRQILAPAMIRVYEEMARRGMLLLVHAEIADPEVGILDREERFIDQYLVYLHHEIPELKIVVEHITTEYAAVWVETQHGGTVAATITPHHLVINLNHLLADGIRPHLYCKPVAKPEQNRLALRKAAVSGKPYFFAGTDSAPHPIRDKETACGCAGIFCAPSAIGTYAEVFEDEGKLTNLEAFLSLNGAAFYGMPVNWDYVSLLREPFTVPERIGRGRNAVVPFRAGETLRWSLAA